MLREESFQPAFCVAALAICLMASSCAGAPSQPPEFGGGEVVARAVEKSVRRSEVREAVSALIAETKTCLELPPAFYLPSERHTIQFGPPSFRGRDIPPDTEQRMDAFVDAGWMTKTPRPDLGERVFQ